MIREWIDWLKERKILLILLGLVVVLLMGMASNLGSHKNSESLTSLSSIPTASSSLAANSSSKQGMDIVVDVKGAVKHEGVYKLPAESRVTDAIAKAGGFTKEADKRSVNLAQKLEDEAVIYVAKIGEEVALPSQDQSGSQHSGEPGSSSDKEKVNLNTATAQELQTIPGIGEKRAQDIINYREEEGGFTQVEELKNISGIGDKTFEKIKDEVTV